MSKTLKLINAVRKDEEGAALVEYALLVGLIAVVCIVAVTQLGFAVSGKLSTACASLATTGTAC
jgi:pilus assembly protein Flp/PilA